MCTPPARLGSGAAAGRGDARGNFPVSHAPKLGAVVDSAPVESFPMSRPLLLGHRGLRSARSIRENTIAAFDLALQHGCDGFEFDVRLSGDRQALVCHDPRAKGMRVSTSTRAQLPHLPTLEEVLSRYAKHGFLDIELKTPDLTDIVLYHLSRHRPERGFLISSFLPAVLVEL